MTGLGYRSDLGACVPVGSFICNECGQRFEDYGDKLRHWQERHEMASAEDVYTSSAEDVGVPEAPPVSVNYTATIYGHSCSITLNTLNKVSLDELVELITNYFGGL